MLFCMLFRKQEFHHHAQNHMSVNCTKIESQDGLTSHYLQYKFMTLLEAEREN